MSNDATRINYYMGVSYIVYCSGHFSKKAAKIVLRLTVVILALGPPKKQRNDTHNNNYQQILNTHIYC